MAEKTCYNCCWGDQGDSEFGDNISGHCWKHNGEADFEQPPKDFGCEEWMGVDDR